MKTLLFSLAILPSAFAQTQNRPTAFSPLLIEERMLVEHLVATNPAVAQTLGLGRYRICFVDLITPKLSDVAANPNGVPRRAHVEIYNRDTNIGLEALADLTNKSVTNIHKISEPGLISSADEDVEEVRKILHQNPEVVRGIFQGHPEDFIMEPGGHFGSVVKDDPCATGRCYMMLFKSRQSENYLGFSAVVDLMSNYVKVNDPARYAR